MTATKIDLRPKIETQDNDKTGIEENFQNSCLRPIIKLQHDLLLACFEHHLQQHRVCLEEMTDEQQEMVIDQSFISNNQLKTQMRSLIIGLFTFNEYSYYLQNSSNINKRINSIISKRVKSVYLPEIVDSASQIRL